MAVTSASEGVNVRTLLQVAEKHPEALTDLP